MQQRGIIPSMEKFSELYGEALKSNPDSAREKALKRYFEMGGFVSVAHREKGWPALTYPSTAKLRQQIRDLNSMLELFSKKRGDWRREMTAARFYNLSNHLKKLGDSLYWQHLLKSATDKDYRGDAKTVKLPAQLVADKRWRPMINMFVNDLDYRKQLTETFENSIIYEKDKELARYASVLRGFRMELSEKKVNSIQKKIDKISADISALREMLRWASSR